MIVFFILKSAFFVWENIKGSDKHLIIGAIKDNLGDFSSVSKHSILSSREPFWKK